MSIVLDRDSSLSMVCKLDPAPCMRMCMRLTTSSMAASAVAAAAAVMLDPGPRILASRDFSVDSLERREPTVPGTAAMRLAISARDPPCRCSRRPPSVGRDGILTAMAVFPAAHAGGCAPASELPASDGGSFAFPPLPAVGDVAWLRPSIDTLLALRSSAGVRAVRTDTDSGTLAAVGGGVGVPEFAVARLFRMSCSC